MHGVGIYDVESEAALRALIADDPAGHLMKYEVYPMPRVVVGKAVRG